MAIALHEKQLPHELQVVDLQDKPDEFVALYRTAISDPNGRGVVHGCHEGARHVREREARKALGLPIGVEGAQAAVVRPRPESEDGALACHQRRRAVLLGRRRSVLVVTKHGALACHQRGVLVGRRRGVLVG